MEYHYRCGICGNLVEPERGDLNSGIKPGVEWEDYPDDWICPICGADKRKYYSIEVDEW